MSVMNQVLVVMQAPFFSGCPSLAHSHLSFVFSSQPHAQILCQPKYQNITLGSPIIVSPAGHKINQEQESETIEK